MTRKSTVCYAAYWNKTIIALSHPAFDGLEALQTLEQEIVDLILLDLMLPGLHGEQLLVEIRRAGTVPVIIISAKTNMEGKVELLRQGADDYITKPFHTGEVLARIQACLRRAVRDNAPPAVLHTHEVTLCGYFLQNCAGYFLSVLHCCAFWEGRPLARFSLAQTYETQTAR